MVSFTIGGHVPSQDKFAKNIQGIIGTSLFFETLPDFQAPVMEPAEATSILVIETRVGFISCL